MVLFSSILNMIRPGIGKSIGPNSPSTQEFCDDCQKNGKCMLADQLIKSSVPVRVNNGHANHIVNDIENWIPHSFAKLRQDSCPFHRQQSLGLAP